MTKIFYCPLEGYKERYTEQWSAPGTGWLERRWIETGVDYHRCDPGSPPSNNIGSGSVVDAVGRSLFSFGQIAQLLALLKNGTITQDDVIYFDDFWTPGMEAIAYAKQLMGMQGPRMYAFFHAQSVDEYDFTHKMLPWIRNYEKGNAAILDGIFVCCPLLKKLAEEALLTEGRMGRFHVTGHPFAEDEVLERMPPKERWPVGSARMKQVVWASRWDEEKNPDFFLQVAREVIIKRPDIKFVICTGAEKMRSNVPELLYALDLFKKKYPDNIIVKEGLTKEQYYEILTESRVQFNCASQDFVAITLLESSTAGCYPVYPQFRSFPETFRHNYGQEFMYPHLMKEEAVNKIIKAIDNDTLYTEEAQKERRWIHSRFNTSWRRMTDIMLHGEAHGKDYYTNWF